MTTLFGSTDFIDGSQTASFLSLGGGANPAPSEAAGGDAILPYGGTLSNLQASAVPSSGSGTVKITVEKNDAGTVLTCTISAGEPLGTEKTCSDTSDSVTFAAGDKITILVNNGTGNFVRYVRWAAQYQ
ncbi:MAG: hypothetical protein WAK93_11830 [Solirubrobacteraceae bacterium]